MIMRYINLHLHYIYITMRRTQNSAHLYCIIQIEDHKEAELDRLTKRRHRPAQHLQLCTRAAEVGFKKLDFYVCKNLKPQQSEF